MTRPALPDDPEVLFFLDGTWSSRAHGTARLAPGSPELRRRVPPELAGALDGTDERGSVRAREANTRLRQTGGASAEWFQVALEYVGYVADVGGAGTLTYVAARAVKRLFDRLRSSDGSSGVGVSAGAAAALALADAADRFGLAAEPVDLLGFGPLARSEPNPGFWVVFTSGGAIASYTVSRTGEPALIGRDRLPAAG